MDELSLYRVTMESSEGREPGWDVYVVALHMAQALQVALYNKASWADAGITVRRQECYFASLPQPTETTI